MVRVRGRPFHHFFVSISAPPPPVVTDGLLFITDSNRCLVCEQTNLLLYKGWYQKFFLVWYENLAWHGRKDGNQALLITPTYLQSRIVLGFSDY